MPNGQESSRRASLIPQTSLDGYQQTMARNAADRVYITLQCGEMVPDVHLFSRKRSVMLRLTLREAASTSSSRTCSPRVASKAGPSATSCSVGCESTRTMISPSISTLRRAATVRHRSHTRYCQLRLTIYATASRPRSNTRSKAIWQALHSRLSPIHQALNDLAHPCRRRD